ncbi:hypothetical protein PybrP1_004428 [[Pythium] brassicae (nom. inval.)]|nr:hypothetical protein PybrP1_004428 [[Pythium] brassicae (nom. inval.)]
MSSDNALVAQMQQRLESVTAAKEANATIGKKLDEKLRVAFKNPPRRPNMAVDAVKQEIAAKELQQSTTSLSNAQEKLVLRDLQQLNDKLREWHEFDKFQAWVDATKAERNERFQQNREFEQQLQQLGLALKKLKVAAAIGAEVADFVTLELAVPADRMGVVIGKQYANLRQLEKDCGVLLDVDNKSNVVRITSAPSHAARAKEAVENISLATNHSIGLHPDTVKMLLIQKSRNLHELEARLGLKIDVNRADGILTVSAAPAKAKLLERAIKELVAGKTELPLPADVVPKLIGKKGEVINQLMDDTGCLVDIDKVTNAVQLCGPTDSVAAAKAFILALVDEQAHRETDLVAGDAPCLDGLDAAQFEFFVEFLMANKAQQLKVLRAACGDAKLKLSKADKKISVIGNKKQLAALDDAVRARVHEFARLHWVYEVADSYLLSLIIGKKGSKIKQVEDEFAAGKVRVDIQGNFVCVLGADPEAIAGAKARILDVVDQNQRAFFLTSQYIVAILLTNKRAKLSEIEQASGCKLNLPPPPTAGNSSSRSSSSVDEPQVKINLTGTLDAITKAKCLLEALVEAHHVRYLPLDDDEIPTVIGKKGETISQLEATSGVKIRVLKESGAPSELEMIGTEAQLAAVQLAIDALLQTQNRQILQLDAFAAGCLIGKKGERIKALRELHPDATVDAFPNRGQVRIKAASSDALHACTEHVLKTLRETLVVESVKVPQPQQAKEPQSQAPVGAGGAKTAATATATTAATNFNTVLRKHEAIAMRLQELEAEGGENMKVTIQEDGKLAKIRGPALGIGPLKRFLEMIVAPEALFVETIPLPKFSYANVLLVKGSESEGKLNENALRICKQTGCEIRAKRTPGAGKKDEGVIRIEGTNATKVYEAKSGVETVLQFYFSDNFHTLRDLPQAAVPRLYELLPSLRATHRVVVSLLSKTSLLVFTDSKQHTAEVVARLQRELEAWKAQHVELPIPAWLVPILVGKNGDTIKKLSAESHGAKLDLSAVAVAATGSGSGGHKSSEGRVLTISAREDASVQLALATVTKFVQHHENLTSTVRVPREKLDLALSAKKEAASGVHVHVLDSPDKVATAELQVVIYGAEYEARERTVEKVEHLLATCAIEKIALPTTLSATTASAVIGALIGKSGANIRALQKEFPGVAIDIQRRDSSISLKGPADDVQQVKRVMEDKVEELLRSQEERHARHAPGDAADEAEEKKPKKPTTATATGDDDGADENAQPRSNRPHIPVGAPPSMVVGKLDKNQRRRMRKRAENERQSDVLSMIMGGSATAAASSAAPAATSTSAKTTATNSSKAAEDTGGYYHSSSGYSLRL